MTPHHYTVTAHGITRTYKTGKAARRAADRLDMAHGSYIACVRPIWGDTLGELASQVR